MFNSLLILSTLTGTHRSYLIADNVVYLVIADKSYPRKLAFSYLDELAKEFATSYGAKVDTVRKPYAFVGFGELLAHESTLEYSSNECLDTFMSKTTRLYQDTRSVGGGSGLDKLNDELQDVTRIMTKNMEELLWRGDSLDRTCTVLSRVFALFMRSFGLRNVPSINLIALGV